jgi:hypothetical protein
VAILIIRHNNPALLRDAISIQQIKFYPVDDSLSPSQETKHLNPVFRLSMPLE